MVTVFWHSGTSLHRTSARVQKPCWSTTCLDGSCLPPKLQQFLGWGTALTPVALLTWVIHIRASLTTCAANWPRLPVPDRHAHRRGGVSARLLRSSRLHDCVQAMDRRDAKVVSGGARTGLNAASRQSVKRALNESRKELADAHNSSTVQSPYPGFVQQSRCTRCQRISATDHHGRKVDRCLGAIRHLNTTGVTSMNKFTVLGALAATTLITACAQQPNAIAAADVSRDAYSGASCRSLQTQLFSVETKLGELSAAQTAEANKDAAWVAGGALLFLPVMAVAASGPDYAGEISSLKGQKNALRAQVVAAGCRRRTAMRRGFGT